MNNVCDKTLENIKEHDTLGIGDFNMVRARSVCSQCQKKRSKNINRDYIGW